MRDIKSVHKGGIEQTIAALCAKGALALKLDRELTIHSWTSNRTGRM